VLFSALSLRTGRTIKNYPIFWEGKGKGNPQLKKNENTNLFKQKTGNQDLRSERACQRGLKKEKTFRGRS
jgi:hypothetical protein